ncbi:hypothetical protein [Herbidospora galbida]|uniref:hypothetical protein n=1 Tax=Herbidospora galbida TaxID=2575442 RepID=UPI0014854804|nr:hypothetical protein [Herbidospora galbida]
MTTLMAPVASRPPTTPALNLLIGYLPEFGSLTGVRWTTAASLHHVRSRLPRELCDQLALRLELAVSSPDA